MSEIYLYIIAIISGSANLFLAWYVHQMLRKFAFLNTSVGNLRYNLSAYTSHLAKVYGSETFYGEPTLEKLLGHSREIKANVEDFCKVFNIQDEENFEDWEWYQYGTDEEETGAEEED